LYDFFEKKHLDELQREDCEAAGKEKTEEALNEKD
jgi:hypothetical protein